MNELKKTYMFGGAAVVLMLLAFISSPSQITPDDFLDKGELFFPDFTDPNTATTLEVIGYDSEAGEPLPFKVEFSGGEWKIPSHNNYPADGKEHLAKVAAGVTDIKKDDFRSGLASDHESFEVIDPLDESIISLTGRGTRVTLKGQNGTLADFIIGKEVPNREGFRFVRLPEQKRVYSVRMNIDLSTKFSDWIEEDLLLVDKDKIKKVLIKDYSINERSRNLDERDVVTMTKDGSTWSADKMKSDQEVDNSKMTTFLTSLDELKIVGIRPKPEGVDGRLARAKESKSIQRTDMVSLQSRGFYFTGSGDLVSNEGEFQAFTDEGIIYTLRFGEIAYGSGKELSAGLSADSEPETDKPGENRYMFISANFDPSTFQEPAMPVDLGFQTLPDSTWSDSDKAAKEVFDTHEEWKEKIANGEKIESDLSNRFGPWYYVISSESFDKLHLTRKDLVKTKDEK